MEPFRDLIGWKMILPDRDFSSWSTITNLTDIPNRSHTNLQDIWTLSHSQIETSLNSKLSSTDIKNNLTSTDTDKPLAALQGKVLNDKLKAKKIFNTTEAIDLSTYFSWSAQMVESICIVWNSSDPYWYATLPDIDDIYVEIVNYANVPFRVFSQALDSNQEIPAWKKAVFRQVFNDPNYEISISTPATDIYPTSPWWTAIKWFDTVYWLDKVLLSDIAAWGYIVSKKNEKKIYKLPTWAVAGQTLNDIIDKIWKKYEYPWIIRTASFDISAQSWTLVNYFNIWNNIWAIKKDWNITYLDIYAVDTASLALSFTSRTILENPTVNLSSLSLSSNPLTVWNVVYYIARLNSTNLNVLKIDITDTLTPVISTTLIAIPSGAITASVNNFCQIFHSKFIIIHNGFQWTSFKLFNIDITWIPNLIQTYTGVSEDRGSSIWIDWSSIISQISSVWTSINTRYYSVNFTTGIITYLFDSTKVLTNTSACSFFRSSFKSGFAYPHFNAYSDSVKQEKATAFPCWVLDIYFHKMLGSHNVYNWASIWEVIVTNIYWDIIFQWALVSYLENLFFWQNNKLFGIWSSKIYFFRLWLLETNWIWPLINEQTEDFFEWNKSYLDDCFT